MSGGQAERKFVLKEATRKRCKIIEADEKTLKRFKAVCLELFHYVREAEKIDFSLFFKLENEIIEFIKPRELSQELLENMWKAATRPGVDVDVFVLKSDYPKFEHVINSVRDKKIKKLVENDGTLDVKTLEVYSTLSTASQMIVRGGINNEVVRRATDATSSLVAAQIDSDVAAGTLSRMIESDATLYDHSASVAMIAAIIATSHLPKPLDEKGRSVVAQCGLYHDAGKSCVPNHVLNKPGMFSPEEFEIMKKHTIYGEQELSRAIQGGAPIDPLAARVAVEHHERFTGKGYPNQRKGRLEEHENGIHLYTRIVSIADVYSALLMKRVYKEALTSKEAIDLMKKVADDDFDPEIFNPFYQRIEATIELFKQREEEAAAKKSSVVMIDENESFSGALKDRK
ncbi:MAG: HD domain-containing protein [Zetaproteobacteria bacterium]|nr:HD domain-containing protein [Zetaproteobacteria bacterium]